MPRTPAAATCGDNFEDKTDCGEAAIVRHLAGPITVSSREQLGDDEGTISTSASDDIYGRPVFEVDADGYTTGISYSDSLLDSTVSTTPPTGAVTVENDNASLGTVTTEDMTSSTVLSETVESLNYAGEKIEEQDYATSGSPQETDLAYNAQGEQNQTTLPNGTIDDTIFDNLGREFEQLTGNSSGAWTTDSEQIYDNNGVGDSDPTEEIADPGGHQEITKEFDNWEDQQVATESGLGAGADTAEQKPVIDFTTVNNLGETTEDQAFDGGLTSVGSDVDGAPQAPSDAAALRAETQYTVDALGDDSQTETMDVDQSNGDIIETDTTTDTFDANGDPTVSDDSGADDDGDTTLDGDTPSTDSTQAVTTTTTDDAGRVTLQTTMAGSTFISSTATVYDADGNAIFVTNTVSQPGGAGNRVTYTGNWYNDDDQLVTSVNYGTNGGTAMSSRPDTAPSRSTTPGAPEVTSYTYTPEGYVDTTTDPRGIVTKKYYDEQGNVTETINNFQGDGTPSAAEPDVNQTTELTYNSDNQLVNQTAVGPGGVNQTTENVYGPSGPDADNSLLLAVEYPDPSTGAPSASNEVTYTYNSNGTVATMIDRDGTTHTYQYDDDGNQIADVITKLGAGVDGTVMERDTDYNDQGQPVDYTTKDADGDILSQVQEPMKLREARTRKRIIVLVGLGLLLPVSYWIWPRLGLELILLEDGREAWAEDFTIAAGERVVGPTIDRIGDDFSGLDKEQSGWTQVLRHFGGAAHQALLRAASSERSAPRRARLISALQISFADYRMLPIWVDDLLNARVPLYTGYEIEAEINQIDGEIPHVVERDKRVNADFARWWNKLSDAQKMGEPLPETGPASGPTTTTRPD